jgi:hypothetical protein
MDRDYINRQLRAQLDSDDPFMTRGHGIKKPRTDDKKSVPDWALNDKEVQKIVLTSFPKYATNGRQRKSAARWIRVIHLYFRMGMTRGQVASEMNLKPIVIKGIIEGIRRLAAGIRYDGRAKLGARPRGRPRKNHMPIQAPISDEKSNLLSSSAFLPDRTNGES